MGDGGKKRACLMLRHLCGLSISRLPLDLLPSPSSGLNGSCLEITVSLGLFDECCNPFGTVVTGAFSVRIGICEVSVSMLVSLIHIRHHGL